MQVTWNVTGILLSEKDGHHGLPVDFDVQVSDTVHAVYSTGDSFHREDDAYLEVISFHKDNDVANRNVVQLQNRPDRGSENHSYVMHVAYDSGMLIPRHCPWDGYFESLDYVKYESFVVR